MGCSCTKAVVSMQVQDRHTGRLMDETVPSYLRSVYRIMYQNAIGRKLIKFPVTTSLLRRATARHGVKMDDPASVAQIEKFIETYGINVEEVELPMDQYLTFNDFFCRKLKAGARPIDYPHDDSILVSPADCRLLVFPSIEDTTKIWLKGQDFTIASLLGPNFQHHLKHFHNPAIAIARLAPQDYHRWHAPLPAKVGPRQSIEGTYFSVSPRAVREVNILCTNKREVCMFDSPAYGAWCMIAVGAAMVSSIIVSPDVKEGGSIAKGAEHGWFRFGGSTLILLFDSHAVEWDADLIEASRKPIETYVKVGTRIGRARRPAARSDASRAAASSTDEEVSASSSWAAASSPVPTSPSLIHTATTDAARKEANLNDEGLLSDFPFAMQSNLTLVPLETPGDTVPARGVPRTTKARANAAEAAGGDISSRRASVTVADLLPAFLTNSEEEEEESASTSPEDQLRRPTMERQQSNSPVPAPQVFHLLKFTGDDADGDECAAAMSESEDDEEKGEASLLLDDEDVDMADAERAGGRNKQYGSAQTLPIPTPAAAAAASSAHKKASRRRSREGEGATTHHQQQQQPEEKQQPDEPPIKKKKTRSKK